MAEATIASCTKQANCNVCHFPSWSFDDSPLDEREINLESIDDLRESAAKGCCACQLFLKVWEYAVPEATEQRGSRLTFNKMSNELKDTVDVHIFTDNGVLDLDLFTLQGESMFMHIRVGNLLPPSTYMEYSVPRIRSWLDACQRDHLKCCVPTTYLPSRLLDISVQETSVQLVDTNDLSTTSGTTAPYACLSHCWGKTRHKHLTKAENLEANLHGIPIVELPRTYRDAIEIARALQLRYLWIDSLCIIQNSDSDWAIHVEAMASIYSNAFITLAAGASPDDEGGFFNSVPDRYLKAEIIKLKTEAHQHQLYVRPCINHPDAKWPASEVLPLMKRGWVFQERLLSRRYLCFGTKEILWECLEEVACSCSTTEEGFNPRSAGLAKFKGSPATKTQIFENHQDHRLWQSLVGEYTDRLLTYSQDRLPALVGLANMFQEKYNMGPYVHGMWQNSLEKNLAWRSDGMDAPLGRPRQGPSWSWAYAAAGRISWPGVTDSGYYRFHKMLDDDGQISKQSLFMSGILLHVSIQTWQERAAYEEHLPLTRYCKVSERDPNAPSDKTAYSPLPGSNDDPMDDSVPQAELHGHFNADYKFWTSEKELQDTLRDSIFFVLGMEDDGYYFAAELAEDYKVWVAGVILKPVGDGSREQNVVEQYERIGWLRYCTDQMKGEYSPKGRKTDFLLV